MNKFWKLVTAIMQNHNQNQMFIQKYVLFFPVSGENPSFIFSNKDNLY